MRKDKDRSSRRSFTRLRPLLIKISAIALIILLALYFSMGYICRILNSSDYFKVKDIIARDTDKVDISYLKGRNIFSLDLKKESLFISESFPDYYRINLIRVLPDRIFVDFVKRKAVAILKLYKYFAIDQEMVLFKPSASELDSGLPVITGLETKIFGPKPGRKYSLKEIGLALNIIRGAKESRILKDYKIKKIDVSEPANASIIMTFTPPLPKATPRGMANLPEGLLEVKFGEDNIKDKLAILAGVVFQERLGLDKVKYIDLRFKEPVIKFKDVR